VGVGPKEKFMNGAPRHTTTRRDSLGCSRDPAPSTESGLTTSKGHFGADEEFRALGVGGYPGREHLVLKPIGCTAIRSVAMRKPLSIKSGTGSGIDTRRSLGYANESDAEGL
jgi:hypothetical protein